MDIKLRDTNLRPPEITLLNDQSTLMDTSVNSLAFNISDPDSKLTCNSSVTPATSDSSVISLMGLLLRGQLLTAF